MIQRLVALMLGLLLAGLPAAAAALDSVDEAERFFESRIRPLLVQRCYKCHSEKASKGGLRLDSREAVLKGGESGAAVVVERPDESLLLEAVRQQNGLAMPPEGKLNEVQIAALADWIKAGAVWPGAATAVATEIAPATHPIVPTPPNEGELSKALQLWLRADSLALDDGAAVYVWPDQSGHGRDFSATKGVRAGGTGLPGRFVRESTLRKRPGVRFETSTGLAASPDNQVEIRGDAALTIVLVMNLQPHEAKPPFDTVLGIGDPAYPGDPGRPLAALVQINQGDDHALHFAGGSNHDASLGPGSFKPYFGQLVLLTIAKQPGPMRSTTRIFINGDAVQRPSGEPLEGTDAVPNIQHRADIGVFLGKALNWAGSIQGDLGEVLVYNRALTDAERVNVESHLAEKSG
ncbi:MAG TPA: c-type cytochrome domain-containing protein [Pirellulales bacterium]|jgi:mono/diheme cytochrome c family protein|nr:c-type cytochrome domain-containing protein [Pirellulales bacterium]